MSDTIRLLPESVANQIAAGEVVQRPASVVKELLENSIDAGSSEIKVSIKDAGRSLIQVIDNGVGMSEVDARMSFEKHATSKIKNSEDLFSIHTMGFRGEALASIAAVAQLEMETCLKKEVMGTRILIEGTEVKKQVPVAAPGGTKISVKNIFFNVPARRNFLKSNAVETKHIIEEFQRVALAHPDVAFSLFHNGLAIQQLPAAKLSHRIVNLFGDTYRERLIPCQETTSLLSLQGYVGKPVHAKKTRGEQFFFVNRRFIKSSYLNHAVKSAFKNLLPFDLFPFYILFLDVDPQKIDVNVHPTKTEIKFEDERAVYSVLTAAIRHALASHHVTPSLDFEKASSFNPFEANHAINLGPTIPVGLPGVKTQLSESRYTSSDRSMASHKSDFQDWKELFHHLKKAPREESTDALQLSSVCDNFPKGFKSPPKVQLHARYILTQVKSGVLLIDQQAAHERILYDRYMPQVRRDCTTSTQKLLFPVHITFSPADLPLVQDYVDELRGLGFPLEVLEKDGAMLTGCPAEIGNQDLQQLLEELLEQFKKSQANPSLDTKESLVRVLAKRTCIQAGKQLQSEEIDALVDQLFACTNPHYAPDGRQVLVIMTTEVIEKMFQS